MRTAIAALVLLASAGIARASALDPTFSGDGIVDDLAPGAVIDIAAAVAVAPDGKILATGLAFRATGPQSFAVFRVLADGTPDPSFGTNGDALVPVLVPGNAPIAFQIVAEPGGGCVVSGVDGQNHATLVRFRNDGTAEPTFGTGGIVTLRGFFQPTALARDPVTGFMVVSDFEKIARVDLTGALDATFGSAGVVTPFFRIAALVAQGDGKIVIAGSRDVAPDDSDIVLRRYDGVGSTDGAFGVGGTVTTAVSPQDDGVGLMALASDGRIIVFGGTASAPGQDLLLRYLPNGDLDGSFGTGGVVLRQSRPTEGIAVDPDGRIVLAGTENPRFPFQLGDPWLVRLLADGTLDPTFPNPPEPFPGRSGFHAVAAQPDGKIVTAGAHDLMTRSVYEVRRYLSDGFCGNTIVDPGEACDDPSPGSCCAANCTFTIAGTSCASDDDACTTDACDGAGTCMHTPLPDDGPLCTVCDSATGDRVQRPRRGCKTTLAPRASSLRIRFDASDDDRDRVTWQWRKGEATSSAELGDPIGGGPTAIHDFCLFDESGPTPALRLATGAGANVVGGCATLPCWRERGTSLVYRSNPPSIVGMSKMRLRSGDDGHARQSLQGKGPALFTPRDGLTPQGPPYALPLRAQLWARDGACWEATYSQGGVQSNGAGSFSAKSN